MLSSFGKCIEYRESKYLEPQAVSLVKRSIIHYPILEDPLAEVLLHVGQTKPTCGPRSNSTNYQFERETTASLMIAITMAILFTVSLSINMIVLAVWLNCKKRQTRDKNTKMSEFELQENSCYEATEMKQMDDAEMHVYEMVQEKRGQLHIIT